MGILDALLPGNPAVNWWDQHNQTITGGLAGLVGAGNDPRAAIQGFTQGQMQGAQTDYARTLASNQLALQVQQRNAAADWLAKSGHPELAGPVRAGAISGADAFGVLNKQTVVPQGASVIDGQGNTTTPGGTGGFFGTDLKSQAWNTVMKANSPGADPAAKQDPKFLTAWAIATEPTMTPQGMMQPQVPPNWGPGAAGPANPQPLSTGQPQTGSFGPVGMGSDVAPIGSMRGAPQAGSAFPNINPAAPPQTGPGIIQGTQPFDESQGRTTFLANSATPDLQRVIKGFPALMNPKDQLLQGLNGIPVVGDLARAAQDPAYKQASDAMKNSMVNLLYFASGANINKDEWARKAESYVPSFLDDPQTAVNKLDRFANDVISLANTTKNPDAVAWAQEAAAQIRQTEQQILSGGQKATTNTTATGVQWSIGP